MKVARFGFSLFGINSYVVYDPENGECAIIDPGMIERREEEALVNFIEKNHFKVTHLINTHLHIDHAIGDKFVSEKYGVPVEAHKADEALGKRMKEQALMFGVSERVNGVEISVFLEDGDKIRIGNAELEVIAIPGHSPGGIVLYDRTDKFIIAGDALFQGSVGRADLPGGDMDQLLESIRKRLLTLPDDVRVLPGHGPETTIGAEKRTNPFLI